MNTGTRKGADTAMRIITRAALEYLWQVHFSKLSGHEHRCGTLHANAWTISRTRCLWPDRLPITALDTAGAGSYALPFC